MAARLKKLVCHLLSWTPLLLIAAAPFHLAFWTDLPQLAYMDSIRNTPFGCPDHASDADGFRVSPPAPHYQYCENEANENNATLKLGPEALRSQIEAKLNTRNVEPKALDFGKILDRYRTLLEGRRLILLESSGWLANSPRLKTRVSTELGISTGRSLACSTRQNPRRR